MSTIHKYTNEQADYVEKNYLLMTDTELAEGLDVSIGLIKKIRNQLGFKRQRQTFHKETPEGMKWCWYCNDFHEKDEFSKNKTRPDGLQDECKRAVKLLILKRKANKNKKITAIKEKECKDCKKTKDISEFIKNVSTIDGYSNLCKECLNKNEITKKFKIKEIE